VISTLRLLRPVGLKMKLVRLLLPRSGLSIL
jgi:hypothetical protein